MLRFLYGSEKTNSYRPEPWAWSEVPFPALRGAGQRYNAFLAVAGGFTGLIRFLLLIIRQ